MEKILFISFFLLTPEYSYEQEHAVKHCTLLPVCLRREIYKDNKHKKKVCENEMKEERRKRKI